VTSGPARGQFDPARPDLPPAVRPRRLWRSLQLRRVLRRLAGPKLIRAFADAYPEARFIEIGANDGVQHDFLSPLILARPWSGVLVEPVPYVFERLRRNYQGLDRVRLDNVAVGDRDGRLPFFHLAEADEEARWHLPSWYDAIGSFSRDALLSHADEIPDLEDRIVRTDVESVTFATLCRRHGVDDLDLLVVDTEGYDHEVIRQVDLATQRPRLAVYEHYHLPPEVRAECKAMLEARGYEAMEEGFDTWCLDARIDDRLLETWRRLRPAVPGVSVHDPKR
jgi:FkbM family methyltransferase